MYPLRREVEPPQKAALGVAALVLLATLALAAALDPAASWTEATAASTLVRTSPATGFASLHPAGSGRAFTSTEPLVSALAFEPNRGQFDRKVRFAARANGHTIFLMPDGIVFTPSSGSKPPACSRKPSCGRATAGAPLRLEFVGATSHPHLSASAPVPGVTNYIRGRNPRHWLLHIPHYGTVQYKNLYRGVTLSFHGSGAGPEFDFNLAPRADLALIRLRFHGAKRPRIDSAGNLVIGSAAGLLHLHQPRAYQEIAFVRRPVNAHFRIARSGQVAFALGPYDHCRPLVIDPVLSYSTLLGGGDEDEATAIALDSSGNVYVTGTTASADFPAPGGALSALGTREAFVTSRRADSSALNYTTLIGGSGADFANSIAVNRDGEAYITGSTTSRDFPATPNVVGNLPFGREDAFVAKLNPGGAIEWATYLGGSDDDSGNAIAIDADGDAYIAGDTLSRDFAGASVNPLQSANRGLDDAFVAELNPAGTRLLYATYLGGGQADWANAIALDGAQNAYIAGGTASPDFPHTSGAFQSRCGTDGTCNGLTDAFVAKIQAGGAALLYSTFLGGSGSEEARGIAVDASGQAYVAGSTTSSDFPAIQAAQASLASAPDAFITALNSSGSAAIFSTYWGGTGADEATAVALDPIGDAYLTGRTQSRDFPATDGFQASPGGGADAFVTEINGRGQIVYSSYLGGSGNENSYAGSVSQPAIGGIAVDAGGNAYLAGNTNSVDFPLVAALQAIYGGGNADAFLARAGATDAGFSLSASPVNLVTSAGSSAASSVSLTSFNSPFGENVTLSCAGLPADTICSFSPPSGTPGIAGFNSTLTVSTSSTTAVGSYALSLVAASGTTSESRSLNLTVNDFHISVSALTEDTINAGSSATATVTLNPINGFAGAVALSCGVELPAGVTCSFNPPGIAGGSGTSTLTVSTTRSAALGPAAFNVVGAADSTIHAAPLTLTINPAPDFTLSATPVSPGFLNAGAAANSTITVAAISGFNSDISLACSSVTPSALEKPACSFLPSAVTGGTGTSTLTISTVPPNAHTAVSGFSRGSRIVCAVVLPLCGFVLLGAGFAPHRRRAVARSFLLLNVLFILASCGARGPTGTPTGSYTIVVTATAAGPLSHNTSLTLTVR